MPEAVQLWNILRLGRPKFLLYSNVMYTIGVAAGHKTNTASTFHLFPYIWECLLVHAIHGMTHYFNEYYDYDADCVNKNPSPWTGGSRVLVERKVKPEASLWVGRLIAVVVLMNSGIIYGMTGNIPLCTTILLGVILGHGYTAWPLETSRRGLGEASICLVLNVLGPLAGYQSLDPASPFGCSLLWPILASMLPIQYVRLIVMNMADYESDKIAGKRTLVVRLGMDLATKIHAVGVVFAYIFHIWLYYAGFNSTLTFLLLLIPAPIGLRQIRNVFVRPWRYDNPFWSSQHNILAMGMALVSVLLSGGRPLHGTSWALVLPLVLISISVPVLFMKIIEAAKAQNANAKDVRNVKVQ